MGDMRNKGKTLKMHMVRQNDLAGLKFPTGYSQSQPHSRVIVLITSRDDCSCIGLYLPL
jgi:hypothetical protein